MAGLCLEGGRYTRTKKNKLYFGLWTPLYIAGLFELWSSSDYKGFELSKHYHTQMYMNVDESILRYTDVRECNC